MFIPFFPFTPADKTNRTGEGNQTSMPQEFILLGLSSHPEVRLALFMAFLALYLVTLLENLLTVLLVGSDPLLHTPMYFFLANLSLLEVGYTSSVLPQMLAHLLAEHRDIPLARCMAQMYLFLAFGITECFLLTVMSYDRYVAICLPLHYPLLMAKRGCIAIVATSWAGGFLVSAINTMSTFQLSFCGHQDIDHFLCEMPAMVSLACAGKGQAQIVMSVSCVFTLVCPFSLIVLSYARILGTVLNIPSTAGRHKAFSTCSSHLVVVSLFFGTVISMYLRPRSSSSVGQLKTSSVFYITVTPVLNPIIYSLRNKEVICALRKMMGKDVGVQALPEQ
ncbi:olfactory receptor-like protein OLF3 [Trachemys scripta elegans]|uniref:olfactory receptor-like protein OLF3 n=1 Tax=Trachemys scripta elegans TaxID=31138 RepID=UPI0015565ADC|nr:olfactory receptor-like protein OLF3 [Trachemys scripta elegans]